MEEADAGGLLLPMLYTSTLYLSGVKHAPPRPAGLWWQKGFDMSGSASHALIRCFPRTWSVASEPNTTCSVKQISLLIGKAAGSREMFGGVGTPRSVQFFW